MSITAKIEKFKNALMEAPFLYRLIVLLVAGVALSFIQAPYHLWPLLFLCFGVFYVFFAQAKNKKQAFFSAYVFALGYFTASLYWIGNALLVEGNDYAWAYPLAVIGLPALLSLFPALFLTISHILFSKRCVSGFFGFCALFALSEWVRGYAFTGFPWNLYGYGWIELLPIAQAVSVIGPYGLTFFTIIWGAVFGFILLNSKQKSTWLVFSLAVITFVGAYFWGQNKLQHNPTTYMDDIALQIIQPNIRQEDKWNSTLLVQNFEQHIMLSNRKHQINRDASKNIIVWPETALPPAFINNVAVNERIYSALGVNDVLLTGALTITQDNETAPLNYHNALLLWSAEHRAKKLYSKSHLVPFGEYIPFQQFIPIPTVTQFSGFSKGEGTQTITIGSAPSFSPLICYEVIFPHQAALSEDKRPDYILTVTNDGWYGDSPGPYQHFTQARFRAIEQGLPVVRSANTGISGVIDAKGRITDKTKLGEAVSLNSQLPKKSENYTFYNLYGDIPFLGFIMGMIVLSVCCRRKR